MSLPVSHRLPSDILRVAAFGGHYRGLFVLNKLLTDPLRDRVKVVGVATDDPRNAFISPGKRVWQYPHKQAETQLVGDLAASHQIPVFEQRVTRQNFRDLFCNSWKPDFCVMATFGQHIDDALFSKPGAGFFNLHPYDGGQWPSAYAGGNPFDAMIRDGLRSCVIGMHHVDADFDTGTLVAKTDKIAILPGASVTDMHKTTSPLAALLVRQAIQQVLDKGAPQQEFIR